VLGGITEWMKVAALAQAHGLALPDIPPLLRYAHHLETLTRFGVVNSRKEAQWIFYSVNYSALKELFNFLWQDCCRRSPDLVQLEDEVSRVL
jgi:hypothetical protein